jgi:tRNA A37 threonylcarbamoyladenosine dehydratase
MKNILNKIKNFFKNVAEKFKSFVKKVADKANDVAQNHGEAIITGATVVGVGAVVGSYFYWQKRFYTTRINAINNIDMNWANINSQITTMWQDIGNIPKDVPVLPIVEVSAI